MAPMDKPDYNAVEHQVKDIIQDLFQVMVQVSAYDSAGRPSKEVLANELQTLSTSLQTLHTTATALSAPPSSSSGSTPRAVPAPLVEYVENGRNPDIYTREFVELVRRMNQLARGKQRAFTRFRDALAAAVSDGMPELRADAERVVAATGGPWRDGHYREEDGAGGSAAGDALGDGGSAAAAVGPDAMVAEEPSGGIAALGSGGDDEGPMGQSSGGIGLGVNLATR